MNMYIAFCSITSIIFAARMTRSIMVDFQDGEMGFWSIFVVYCLLIVSAVVSLVFAYNSLSKPGISQSARTLVLKRHAAGIIIFLLTNLYIIVLTVYLLFP